MAYPTTFTNAQDTVTEIIAAHINALEVKVGIDNDPNTDSLDYRMKIVDVIDKIWVYMDSAPTGWQILSGPADCVLSVKGGSNAYNANGGTLVGTWDEPNHTHNYTTVIAHVHSIDPPNTATTNESAHTHGVGSFANTAESAHTHSISFTSGTGSSHGHGVSDPTHRHPHVDRNGNACLLDGYGYWAVSGGQAGWTLSTGQSYTGYAATGISIVAESAHTHSISGTSAAGSSHNHTFSGTSAAGSSHNHSVDIAAFNSASTGSASGTTGGGATANTHRPYAANGIVIERS